MFEKIFVQYQTNFKPALASRLWTRRCRWLIGKPEDLGLDMLSPAVKDSYYNIKIDRIPPADAAEFNDVWRPDMQLAELHRVIYAPTISRGAFWVSLAFCSACCVLAWVPMPGRHAFSKPASISSSQAARASAPAEANGWTKAQCEAKKYSNDMNVVQACQALGVANFSYDTAP